MARFYGRSEFLDDLSSLWRKGSSSIVACRGRRRIGKSTLVREFAHQTSSAYIEIEGLSPQRQKPMTNQDQLDNFIATLSGFARRKIPAVDNWLAAFAALDELIDDQVRTVILLDEVSGELHKDFDAIFNPIYGSDIPAKISILEALGDGPQTGSELSATTELCRNGRLSDLLKDLSGGGFITPDLGKNPETGKESRIFKYRLRDNYTRFYLKYIEPHRGEIERGSYRYVSIDSLPGWETVRGLLFENLIVNNANALIPFLGVGNAIIESAAPYRNVRKGPDGQPAGLQVDLLMQTACTAYVIEIKRRRYIGPEVEEEVRQKIKRLPLRKGLSVRPALVYDGELAPSVEGRGFFDAIIPASRLLRP